MKITSSFTIRYIARRPSGTWHTFEIEARARLEHDQADALNSEIKQSTAGYALELASPAEALVWWVEKLQPLAHARGAELLSVTLPDGDRSYSWP